MTVLAGIERPVAALARIGGLALLAGATATAAGAVYRWFAREEIPEGLAILVGLGVVGGWLNTTTALRQFLGSQGVLPPPTRALTTVVAFALSALAAALGARWGGRVLADAASLAGDPDRDVGRLVRSVGRFVTVELPDEIGSIDGYEPLDPETAAALSGKTFRFPRGLTVAELRDRLVERLRHDYAVGRVDVELADDGSVEYLAAGGRAVGIGPTLAPGTVAVAVRADPAFTASAGDLVQVWRDDGDPERVATAELRAAVGDVVTLACSADDAARFDPDVDYRLVTLPTERRADREFSARLRAADETVDAVTLTADSPLVGAPVGSIAATVVAIETADGVETIPSENRPLAPDDTLYVVARPDVLRKVEAAASGEAGATATTE